MNRESASSKLRAIAQIRIEQHLVSAQTETGEGLPSEVLNGVRNVLCGPHKTFRYMLFNGMGRPIDLSRPCQTLPASMGGNKTPIIDTRLLRNPDSPDWLKRLHARASKGEDISGVKVPSFMRRITVSEAAALQGFPMDFKFLGSRCDKYRQIGNSVLPPLAEAIAMEVVKAMLKTDR